MSLRTVWASQLLHTYLGNLQSFWAVRIEGKRRWKWKKKKKEKLIHPFYYTTERNFALLPHAWQHCQVADYSLSLINHLQKSCEKQNGVYPKFIRTKLLNKGQHTAAFLGLQPHNFKKLSAANRSTFQYYS